MREKMFQSPKSGKFESNTGNNLQDEYASLVESFNPLNRGNLNQIKLRGKFKLIEAGNYRFNPLNRGNLNQIA